MLADQGFSKKEKYYLFALLVFLLFAFFFRLGDYPLILEETRRAIIALEMTLNENLWVPLQTGDLYLRKPPVYNWFIILFANIFGSFSEFSIRFFSVVSHILLAGVTYLFVKKYFDQVVAVLTALSYLIAVDILFYFSLLGEIDLFYALITAMSMFYVYHAGARQRYLALFLVIYGLTAIGFLTKGLSSLPFLVITLLVYFIQQRKFKLLFSWQHVLGILFFSLILGAFFLKYNQYADAWGWWRVLFEESSIKVIESSFDTWLVHLFIFPFDTLKNILPVALLLPLFYFQKVRETVLAHSLIRYSLAVFFFNICVYWLSTQGSSRYIYSLFPFIILVIVYAYHQQLIYWMERYLRIVAIGLLTLASVILPILLLTPRLEIVNGLLWICLLSLLLVVILWWLLLRNYVRPYLVIMGLLVVLKLGFNSIMADMRTETSYAALDRALGIDYAEQFYQLPMYRYGDVRISLGIVFYLERGRQRILRKNDRFMSNAIYFVHEKDRQVIPEKSELIDVVEYNSEKVYLVKIK